LEIGTPDAPVCDMGEIAEQVKRRTMRFSLDVCALIQRLPSGEPGCTVQHQLAKAATSVAFNYRAACRGRSHAEYTAKIGLVSEESDESLGWLEFIEAAELLKSEELQRLLAEARPAERLSLLHGARGIRRPF
jgi:four helix bundle protein